MSAAEGIRAGLISSLQKGNAKTVALGWFAVGVWGGGFIFFVGCWVFYFLSKKCHSDEFVVSFEKES